MPNINIRCDASVVTDLERLQRLGYGASKTEVVLAALVLLGESTLVELAAAKMARFERDAVMGQPAIAEAVSAAVEPEPVIVRGCEECGAPFAPGNTRFCEAHIPELDA